MSVGPSAGEGDGESRVEGAVVDRMAKGGLPSPLTFAQRPEKEGGKLCCCWEAHRGLEQESSRNVSGAPGSRTRSRTTAERGRAGG